VKILTFSTLYPNKIFHQHGIFVENRLRYLLANGNVQSKVIAPIPWFPLKHERFGDYAKYAQVPEFENRHGIDVIHPRYALIPKVGMTMAPLLLAMATLRPLKKILADGYDFQIIDAHYFYPDGVAAYILGKLLGKPVIITCRGSDISLIPIYFVPRHMIKWSAKGSAGLITVCQALKDSLVSLGIEDQDVTVLRNGVDLQKFKPVANRDELRKSLSIKGTTLLSVGHLIHRKGHHLIIKALEDLPNVSLLIAGDGVEESNLKELAKKLQFQDRVRFLGSIPHDQLVQYYAAVDMLILASSREGWANVLLESMACGTPVVATKVWGTPEVVTQAEAGVLVDERSSSGIANGVKALLKNYPDRKQTRLFAEKFSWDATTLGQEALFDKILRSTVK